MASAPPATYYFAGLQFDRRRGLERDGRLIPLAPLERRVLECLLAAGANVLSKDALVAAVWRRAGVSDDSVSRVVHRLRQNLRAAGVPDVLVTVYGTGFRIAVPVVCTPVRRHEPHPLARDCFFTARELCGRPAMRDMMAATAAAARAVRLDKAFVDGWILLAQITLLRLFRGLVARRSGLRRIRLAAGRALALAPDSHAALALLGLVQGVADERPASGLASIDRALTGNELDASTHSLRALALFARGDRQGGLAAFEAGRRLNPLAATWTGAHGYSLACAGQHEEALALLNAAIRRTPTLDALFFARSSAAAIAGDLKLALADAHRCVELAPDVPAQRYALACALAASGERGKARDVLAHVSASRFGIMPSWHAVAVALLEDHVGAARHLALARTERCVHLALVQYDPRLVSPRRPAMRTCSEPAVWISSG
jgi:DNA-binding winged helix-turn-helix (wHTH) protein/Flp pilus assembly protein TadD